MGRDWFANRGQVIQTVLAALACFFTGRELIVDFIAKQPPSNWALLGFGSALAVFGMMIYRGRGARDASSTATDQKPEEHSHAGPVRLYSEKVAVGDYWRSPDDNDFRIEVHAITKSKTVEQAISDYTVEIALPARGYGFKTGRFVVRKGDSRYLMPVATFAGGSDACSIIDVRFSMYTMTVWMIHLEHVNPETKAVELVVRYLRSSLSSK